MNTHFLAYMLLTYGIVKALEFVASFIFTNFIPNPTAAKMLGYGG
jgi:hypothetical protein